MILSSLFGSSEPQPQPPNTQTPTQEQTQEPTAREKLSPEPEIKIINPNTKYKLLLGGLTFIAFSLMGTRRALNRRYLATIPPYYTSSLYHKPNVNGGMEAFEALNLATINVASFGMAGLGGVMCLLDINGIEDLRALVKKGFYGDGGVVGKTDVELEEEIAEWVGGVLGKKYEREIQGAKERGEFRGEGGKKE